jgi:hypothetical protein
MLSQLDIYPRKKNSKEQNTQKFSREVNVRKSISEIIYPTKKSVQNLYRLCEEDSKLPVRIKHGKNLEFSRQFSQIPS